MSCLEHLVENCFTNIVRNNATYDEAISAIKNDVNYEYAGITAEQCYKICVYFYSTYHLWSSDF